MNVNSMVRKNAYYDSVTLMIISRELKKIEGVDEVLVGMGTDLNVDLVEKLSLATPELEGITPNDLFIAAKYDESKCTMEQIIQAFDEQINAKQDASAGDYQPPTLSSAVEHLKGANLVQISIPGRYAAREAEDALDKGLNVMLFSDNVSVEDELKLKRKPLKRTSDDGS